LPRWFSSGAFLFASLKTLYRNIILPMEQKIKVPDGWSIVSHAEPGADTGVQSKNLELVRPGPQGEGEDDYHSKFVDPEGSLGAAKVTGGEKTSYEGPHDKDMNPKGKPGYDIGQLHIEPGEIIIKSETTFSEKTPYKSISLSEESAHDFARCMRPNGTFYGTRGECKKPSVRADRRPSIETNKNNIQKKKENQQLKPVKKQTLGQRPKEEVNAQRQLDKKISQQIEEMDGWFKEHVKKNQKDVNELADKVKKSDDGNTMIISSYREISMTRKIGDHTVSLKVEDPSFEPKVSFEANESYNVGSIKDPKTRVKAVLAVRSMFNALTKHMTPGEYIRCTDYGGDGRGAQRKKAYEKLGFRDTDDGWLTGVIKEGGGIVSNPGYSEMDENLKIWYVMLFGLLPNQH